MRVRGIQLKTLFIAGLAFSLLGENVYAQEDGQGKGKHRKDKLIEERDRAHSVREVVQSVSEVKEKEVSEVNGMKNMFENGEVMGQIKTMYAAHKIDRDTNTYATAIGGSLKYELAQYRGFNAGFAFTTTHDVDFLTGEGDKHNYYLSTREGSYTQLSEVYLNYSYKDFRLRAGRQVVDTPLADSDDVRMISNTFEAYTASFEFNRWTFMAGKLQQWQGSGTWNARETEGWQNTGDDGAYFGGVALSKVLLDFNLWYYDFSEDNDIDSTTGNIANASVYTDFSLHNKFGEDFLLHTNFQYLHQNESDNSLIQSSIYGVLVEFVAHGLGFSVAYNKAQRKAGKGSFSGYGGGTLYTNMDNMLIDNISFDREVEAVVAGISYSHEDFGFLYAYGNFDGDKDSLGQTEHIVEQNIGAEYKFNEDLNIAAICVINDNKEDTTSNIYFNEGDFVNYRIWLTYNF